MQRVPADVVRVSPFNNITNEILKRPDKTSGLFCFIYSMFNFLYFFNTLRSDIQYAKNIFSLYLKS